MENTENAREQDVTVEVKTHTSNKTKVEKVPLAKYNELNDKYLRSLAEFENYKKRMEVLDKEKSKYYNQLLLEKLINVTDVFEKAVNYQTDNKEIKNFLVGFQMLNTMFNDILKDEGVSKINALNAKFDPKIHNCIQTKYVADKDLNTVIEEVQTGYMIKDRVLRPSVVIVNQKDEVKEDVEGGKKDV